MVVIKRKAQEGEKEWEDPINPEGPVDSRDEEQMQRQKKEAHIRKENLTEDNNSPKDTKK